MSVLCDVSMEYAVSLGYNHVYIRKDISKIFLLKISVELSKHLLFMDVTKDSVSDRCDRGQGPNFRSSCNYRLKI